MGRHYRTYATDIKVAIFNSKNPRLFPEKKIPVTTARHWIRTGERFAETALEIVKPDHFNDPNLLLEICRILIKSLGENVNCSRLGSHELELLTRSLAKKEQEVFRLLGRKLFNRFCRIILPCTKSVNGLCVKRFSSQLTAAEIRTMKDLVTSKKYAHMSISSLSLFALRKRLLLCSAHTWYKYISLHKWQRPHVKKKKMPRSPGLKASAPNEVWHIDVTEILSLDGNKHFLQVVYDNYSRYVIAWSLNARICAANTERLLKRARRKTVLAMDNSLLIVDGGSENTAQRVSSAIARFKPQMIRRIARKEIKNSNTMIEIFFKMLKSNHLKFVVLRHRRDVAREVAFYVHQHNNIVPMRVLAGDTPAETLYRDGGKNSSEAVAEILNSRRIERIAENQSGFCQICL